MDIIKLKPLFFMGSALKDLRTFPKVIRVRVGRALQYVQAGHTPQAAKPLKALSSAMEILSRYDSDTYRVVYVANIGGTVYVLHCFKKKSKRGIKTSKQDIDLIRRRLGQALEHCKEN